MKTIAYIDGYNLYYSLLRGSPYKWLDIVVLLADILRVQDPKNELLKVKFFTAPVLASYARHGDESVAAQSSYLRGLSKLHGARFEHIHGRHAPEKIWLPVVGQDKKMDRENRQQVWNLREKQTDVNLTLHMYKDAISKCVEQVVLVSNDSDFEPVVRAIRMDTAAQVGLITPLPASDGRPDGRPHRRPSVSLMDHSHWTRTHILSAELEAAQMKPVIPTNRNPIRKPGHW